MLRLESVSAGYQKKPVIENISLKLEKGEITSVIGPNGSGKSTLLKAMVDICGVYKGEIFLDNVPKSEVGRRNFSKRVSYLPQNHAGGAITVSRMVLHGRFPHLSYPRHYEKKDHEACDRAMETAGILPLRDRKIEELSGGQRQKVYLAMALAGEMDVYLLDEPSAYLDVRYQMELLEIMRRLKKQGKTVAAVLHDLNAAVQIADRILVMDQGRAVFKGTPGQVLQSGVIDRVFKVRTKILKDEKGTDYLFFERMGKE